MTLRKSATRLCPVCLQDLKPTRARNIPQHFDSNPYAEATCPGGGQPYKITLPLRSKDVWASQHARAAAEIAS